MIKKFLKKKINPKNIGVFKKTTRPEEKTFESVEKFNKNPIIKPDARINWKSWQTFNPTALYLNNSVHLLYRAIGNDGVSRFGYARSENGFTIDECPPKPAYRETDETVRYTAHVPYSGGSFAGCEDPRLVYMKDEETIYLMYTSCIDGLRVGLSSIAKDDFLAQRWKWKTPQLISPPGEVHKNWVLFPEKIRGKYAICHALNPISIAYVETLDFNGTYISSHYNPGEPSERWDSYMRGAGPAPLKTDEGWILFYHAMNHRARSEYKVGAFLLDQENPIIIRYRSHMPIITPRETCETHGYKGGVVYTLGSVIKEGTLFLYYGGADSYVCVAHAPLNEFLKELKTGSTSLRSKLTRTLLKIRL